MDINIRNSTPVQDVWVFDYFVIIQYPNKSMSFFEKPLIRGTTSPQLNVTSNFSDISPINGTQIRIDSDVKSWDISISPDNDTSVFYFAITNSSQIKRWHFNVDIDHNLVTLIDVTTGSGTLVGNNITSILSNIYYIIASD